MSFVTFLRVPDRIPYRNSLAAVPSESANNPRAQNYLGRLFHEGRGVTRDKDEVSLVLKQPGKNSLCTFQIAHVPHTWGVLFNHHPRRAGWGWGFFVSRKKGHPQSFRVYIQWRSPLSLCTRKVFCEIDAWDRYGAPIVRKVLLNKQRTSIHPSIHPWRLSGCQVVSP